MSGAELADSFAFFDTPANGRERMARDARA
jgi:hypothetical protein